jgi:hypothetical protein
MDKLRSTAGFIALAGLISIGLHLFGYSLRILAWIDLWGTAVGWLIRVALLVGGAVLYFVLPGGEEEEGAEKPPSEPD